MSPVIKIYFGPINNISMSSRCWAGLGWAGLGWAGLGWAGLGWAGLDWNGMHGLNEMCELNERAA